MNKTLENCKKIEIRESSVEGYGVFATDFIKKGEVLEEVPFVLFPRYTLLGKSIYEMMSQMGFINDKEKYFDNLRQNLKFKDPEKYYFKWFPQVSLGPELLTYTVLPLGFGPIYNTANIDNNAGWTVKEKTFIFRAEQDIFPDQEIRTFYGYFVGQDGTIFNCDGVFNLAIDYVEGIPKCKMVRFGNPEQFEQAKSNPSYARIYSLFSAAKKGLRISKISALLPSLEEKVAADIMPEITLSTLYQKLLEFRQSNFPLIKIVFEWEDIPSGEIKNDPIIFRK